MQRPGRALGSRDRQDCGSPTSLEAAAAGMPGLLPPPPHRAAQPSSAEPFPLRPRPRVSQTLDPSGSTSSDRFPLNDTTWGRQRGRGEDGK